MIAPTTTQRDKQQRLPLPRTRRRLAEAQAALDRGEPTVAVIIIRAAIETAAWEIVGPIEGRTFVRMICCSVAGKQRSKKIEGRYGNANKVVHGIHDASHREAKRMLWLLRIIGGRWVRRVFGVDVLEELRQAMAETSRPPQASIEASRRGDMVVATIKAGTTAEAVQTAMALARESVFGQCVPRGTE